MKKIDTSDWKAFRVGDLFDISYGKFKPQSDSVEEGGIPHITTTQINNGIGYYVKDAMFPANCITVASDGCQGASFYHDYPISASNIVSVLQPYKDTKINHYIGKFLCSLFRVEGQKYSWGGFKFSVDRVRETLLKLPQKFIPDFKKLAEYIYIYIPDGISGGIDMSKIDTSGWREFKIGDLFESAERGEVASLLTLEEGAIPVIAAGKYNQGIAGYYNVKAKFQNKITISCNGAGCGSTFYHDYPFNLNGDAIVLHEKYKMPEIVLKYLACMIDGILTRKYSYEEKCSAKKALLETILLPAIATGEPDWDYMEEYMKKQEEFAEHLVEKYKRANETKQTSVDIHLWKEFKLSDIGFTIFHGKRLTKSDRVPGNIPLVTAGEYNQGIAEYIGNNWPTYNNAITVDMFGNCFYHAGLCTGDDNVYFFINENDHYDEFVKTFIASIISNSLQEKYSYKKQFRQSDADALTILLPITPDGAIDFAFIREREIAFEQSEFYARYSLLEYLETGGWIWKKYAVGDLFDLSLPKGDLQVKLVEAGSVPLITPSNDNNGVLMKIDENSNSTKYNAKMITVDMFGNAYYQDEMFFVTAHGHVNVAIPKFTINQNIGLFIATAIKAALLTKYGFSSMCTQKVLKNESLFLPSTTSGKPNWSYMENYMKNIKEKIQTWIK